MWAEELVDQVLDLSSLIFSIGFRLGLFTSSPWQFGQQKYISSEQDSQKVHS